MGVCMHPMGVGGPRLPPTRNLCPTGGEGPQMGAKAIFYHAEKIRDY